MKKVRVAIVGQGRSGRDIHGAWLMQDQGRYEIVAAVDPIKHRRDRAAEEFGCDVYRDNKKVLERDDLDLIINASPSHLHVPISHEILKAGHNCLCEKPLANKVKDVDKLIAASKKSGKLLAIFQQSRFAPYFNQVQKVIDSGVLGRIVQIKVAFSGFSRRYDWQTLQEFMAGNLLNTGPHPLDQALALFGFDKKPDVHCIYDRVNAAGDAEDHVLMVLSSKDESRPVVEVEVSSCWPFPKPIYEIYGSNGGMTSTMTEAKWRYIDPKENPRPRLKKKPLTNPDGTPAYPSENLKWINRSWKLPKSQSDLFTTISKRFYSMLYKTLVKGEPLEVTAEQVRRQVAVIEECIAQNRHVYSRK